MPSFRHHVFVCTNQRLPGNPKGSCGQKGSVLLLQALKGEVEARGLRGIVKVSSSGCLGPCAQGCTAVVYPEGAWYGGLTPEDAPALVERHLMGGEPLPERVLAEDTTG
jgi:(2Fe-2S) ferredoxin